MISKPNYIYEGEEMSECTCRFCDKLIILTVENSLDS